MKFFSPSKPQKTLTQASTLTVRFTREEKQYSAEFAVTREENGRSYHLHADVYDSKKTKIFTKDRYGLDFSQVNPAILYVFHQAFSE